ncbi:retrovirus-related pol polyprotein from transposon TNT 1-94, partial [Tanacetum coccineum]
MVQWIMTYVKSLAFSICVNGISHGYFKRDRGLRQGDPMLPYLFTLVMEIFNLIMMKKIEEAQSFKYHFGCKEVKLTNLCFADDLLVVCNGDKYSLEVVKSSLNEFSLVSGLFSNLSKSTIFFGSVNEKERNFQDSPDDEENTRSSHEYLNDLEEEYQGSALLAKSKRFFKKGTQSSSASASKAATVKNKGLIAEVYKWDEEEVSSYDNEMCINEQILSQKKRIMGADQLTEDPSSSGQKDIIFVKSSADDTKVSIPGVERPWLSEFEGFIMPNYDTGRILPVESQKNTIDPSIAVIDSLTTDYDSADESSVYSTPLPPLKKLDGVEPISGPKTI